ncbi:hypothetical protein SAMN05421686_11252 [Thalassolituus maritimus]|uniref:STAS domain-containing protein n=1 Tax=Thalassolituus maritimus TaxID=484498 RepID=A0A1N7PYV4_9GAMM|nr:hypothetical protein SAMN05421686_11252 [Thalassolituus maritimus]
MSQEIIILDFSSLEEISAAGAVALFARVTSAQISSGNDQLFQIIQPKKHNVRKQFRGSGLFNALRPGGRRKLDKLWDEKSKFLSGYDQEKHLDPTLDLIGDTLDDGTPNHLKEAINEAILNIQQHAYRDPANGLSSGLRRRWWQYCYLDRDSNRFIFVISDLGQSIPSSFSQSHRSHEELIAHAMKKGVSSTGDPWRGKGSQNIKDPVELEVSDKLIVISGNGLYVYNSSNIKEELAGLSYPYYGTLIAWSFDLLGGKNDNRN